jgi:hypothetical protein
VTEPVVQRPSDSSQDLRLNIRWSEVQDRRTFAQVPFNRVDMSKLRLDETTKRVMRVTESP